jgi:hypothetical protein
MTTKKKTAANAENLDPISGEPGAHPVGVGAGTAIGGAAAGTVTGGVGGGIVGANAGKAVAERINPTEEDAFWQANYRTRPYASGQIDYNVYRPAYRYGWETRGAFPGRLFEDVEPELRAGWGSTSNMKWVDARAAVRDAWERIDGRSATVGPGNSSIHEVRNTESE